MTIFQPPTDNIVPPIYLAPDRYRPVPRLSQRLFSHRPPAPRGRNVYLLVDGTVTEQQPYEAQPGTVIQRVFFGGHIEPVNAAEVAILTAAGYGAYIT